MLNPFRSLFRNPIDAAYASKTAGPAVIPYNSRVPKDAFDVMMDLGGDQRKPAVPLETVSPDPISREPREHQTLCGSYIPPDNALPPPPVNTNPRPSPAEWIEVNPSGIGVCMSGAWPEHFVFLARTGVS
ncbi:MAG: hypothetical protein WCV82_04400 [Candidatus Paceibacterota bacterium]